MSFTLKIKEKDRILIVENVPISCMHVDFASKQIEFPTGYIALMQASGMRKSNVQRMVVATNYNNQLQNSRLHHWDIIPKYRKYSSGLKWKKLRQHLNKLKKRLMLYTNLLRKKSNKRNIHLIRSIRYSMSSCLITDGIKANVL